MLFLLSRLLRFLSFICLGFIKGSRCSLLRLRLILPQIKSISQLVEHVIRVLLLLRLLLVQLGLLLLGLLELLLSLSGLSEGAEDGTVINLVLTVVSLDLILDFVLILAVQAVRVANLTSCGPNFLKGGDEAVEVHHSRLILLVSLNVLHLEDDVHALVLLQDLHSVVHLLVVDEGTADLLEEVVSELLGHADPDVGHAIVDEGEELVLEMLLK
mmetsp:Transcript_8712/g.14774  ORF Transcript_8712/g.14774 Transcript_8712/m.14774 type:complete len:214 (-) Transcript_8712:821-1462(-)